MTRQLQPIPDMVRQYYVFVASTNDLAEELAQIRRFFEVFNHHTGLRKGAMFVVLSGASDASLGVGDAQEQITAQILDQYKNSLVLFLGVLGQRIGSPTARSESGTVEEFDWALASNQAFGFPEIKFFFKEVEAFTSGTAPREIAEGLKQWIRRERFKRRLERIPVFTKCYKDPSNLYELCTLDVQHWMNDVRRPWR